MEAISVGSGDNKMKVLTLLVSLTLFLSVLNFAGMLLLSSKVSGGSAPSGAVVAPTGGSSALPTADVSADDDAVLGDPNAPVTIIEFSDYQCPFCQRFWSESLPLIKKNYIETGKAKLVYRDFPLGFHQYAQKAAEAAECAGDQGKYWEMHDTLFANINSLTINDLKGYAADLGLNTADFNKCLDTGKYTSEVQADLADGSAAGVSGTPSFFINGVQIVGAQPYSAFQQAIEAALAA